MTTHVKTIAVIGLGYVGLPLAVEFGKARPVIGFDINASRIDALRVGHDATLEVSKDELATADQLTFTSDPADLAAASIYIVTVPTPIDAHKRPDLTPLLKASEMIGGVLKRGDIVIFESTVYPGATEEDCVPVLERVSGLTFNVDFFAGYSPERINPGDKAHRLPDILQGDVWLHTRDRRRSRSTLCQHHHRRHLQGGKHPGGRGRQSHREYAARSERCAHE